MSRNARQTKAEYIISQINVYNAKKVACLMVFGFIIYHGLIHIHYGEYFNRFSLPIIKGISC